MIRMHRQDVHPQAQPPPQAGDHVASTKPRVEAPNQDEFTYFQAEWKSYKRSCGITDEVETRDQLWAACNEELRRNLHNCLGTKLENLTEQQLMDEIQKTAVLAQNNLVKIVQLLALFQEREEPIRTFFARLKAAASACELSVQCTAVACTEKVP